MKEDFLEDIKKAISSTTRAIAEDKEIDVVFEDNLSSADNKIVLPKIDNNEDLKNLNQLYKFLSTTFAMFLFETTRYRMKYLERYCFEFIPNICNIKDFPKDITNDELCNFFNLNDLERKMINSFYKKKYIFFTQKNSHQK